MPAAKKPKGGRYGKLGNTAKNNPLLIGASPLEFDDMDPDQLVALTPKQHADIFFSEWLRDVDPLVKYQRWFADRSDEGLGRYLATLKRMFIHFVAEGDWSEEKFVMVVDHMLSTNMSVYTEAVAEQGERYDNLDLPFQRKAKRMQRGRI